MNKQYFNTYIELIQVNFVVFRQLLGAKIIDLAIWGGLTIFVTGYIMPYFGLTQNFGPFQLGGILAAIGLFELYTDIFELVADLEGDHVINYALTLPVPSWMVFASKITYHAITYMILSCIMFFIGVLFLWNQISLVSICYSKLLIALIAQSIFYACLVPLSASFIMNISHMRRIWMRVIFPMWFMGGFQFSWNALHHVVPNLAYLDLANPMIYITESTRAALLGQEGYLPFWLCISILIFASIFCIYYALKRMKQRLDFV